MIVSPSITFTRFHTSVTTVSTPSTAAIFAPQAAGRRETNGTGAPGCSAVSPSIRPNASLADRSRPPFTANRPTIPAIATVSPARANAVRAGRLRRLRNAKPNTRGGSPGRGGAGRVAGRSRPASGGRQPSVSSHALEHTEG